MYIYSYILKYYSEDCNLIFKHSVERIWISLKLDFIHDFHTCLRVFTQLQTTIAFVSDFTTLKLVNYKIIHTPNDIVDDIKNIFDVDISYQKAWKTKESAIEMLRKKSADGYRQMPRNIYMLNSVYFGFHMRMHTSEDNKFMYMFIAL